MKLLYRRDAESSIMLSKPDTIEEITKLNPTVNPTFLADFSKEELNDYLVRLHRVTKEDPFSRRAIPRHSSHLRSSSPTHKIGNE